MIRRRAEWALRHPVSAVGGLLRWLERHPSLPIGRSAGARRLLRDLLPARQRALVVGPPHVIRQALPEAVLDVVGTNPNDVSVTVVSGARGAAALPRRWDCVIVTERFPEWERLVAAAGACLPGGALIVLGTPRHGRRAARRTEMQDLARSSDVRLIEGAGAQ